MSELDEINLDEGAEDFFASLGGDEGIGDAAFAEGDGDLLNAVDDSAFPTADESSEDEVPLSAIARRPKPSAKKGAAGRANGKASAGKGAKAKSGSKAAKSQAKAVAIAPTVKNEVVPAETPSKSAVTSSSLNFVPPKPIKAEPKAEALTMEERIVNLLVPGMRVQDIMSLLKKLRESQKVTDSEGSSPADADPKTAPRYTCDLCGNTDQQYFVQDYARGDTVCRGPDGSGCGNVVQDHIVYEGNAYRKFEGEEDKSHHGQAPNKLFSSSFNLRTGISTVGQDSGQLRRAAEYVEMNLSQMGKDDRRTRVGYKDQMKKKAFELIVNAAHNLDIHEQVITKAQLMFASFRDDREHVHQFEAMVAACIMAAFLESGKAMYDATQGGTRQKTSYKDFLSSLNKESKEAEDDKLPLFECRFCGATFNAKKWLQYHNCSAAPEKGKEKNSDTAQKKPRLPPRPPSSPPLSMNLTANGNGKKWFQCPECPMKFLTQAKLDQHAERHSRKRKVDDDLSMFAVPKVSKLASPNPSVQLQHVHDKVSFRGQGLRPWLEKMTTDGEDI